MLRNLKAAGLCPFSDIFFTAESSNANIISDATSDIAANATNDIATETYVGIIVLNKAGSMTFADDGLTRDGKYDVSDPGCNDYDYEENIGRVCIRINNNSSDDTIIHICFRNSSLVVHTHSIGGL